MSSTVYKEVPRGFYAAFVVSEKPGFLSELITSAWAIDPVEPLRSLATELENRAPPKEAIVAHTNVDPFTKTAKCIDGTTLILWGPTDDLLEDQVPFMLKFAQEKGLRLFVLGVREPLWPGLVHSFKGMHPSVRLCDLPQDVARVLFTGNAEHLPPKHRPRYPTLAAGIEIDYEEVTG